MRLDYKFKLLKEVRISVSSNYDHAGWLDGFIKNNGRAFDRITPYLKDIIFHSTQTQLIPGAKYKVSLYMLLEESNYEECRAFIINNHYKTALTGPRGLTMLWQMAKKELPSAQKIISLDEKEYLWTHPVSGISKIPSLYLDPKFSYLSGWAIDLLDCDTKWERGMVIARFRRIS